MLNSVPGRSRRIAASSRTSFARTCRPSGRGCTVTPCAPASSTRCAARSTLGIPIVRVLRSSATLLRLALSSVIRFSLERQQIPEDLPAPERLVFQAVVDESAHERLRLLLRLGIGIVVARHIEKRAAGHERLDRRALDLDRSAFGIVSVGLRRIDRAAICAVALEGHRVTELLEQRFLEGAERRRRAGLGREPREGLLVAQEQGVMRIFARQETQQQLVQIKAAQQGLAAQQRLPAGPFGTGERAHLALAEPGESQGLESEQHAAQRRPGAARSSRDHGDPAEAAGEYLDEQARFTIRIAVKDECLPALLPGPLSHSRAVLRWPRRRSSRGAP